MDFFPLKIFLDSFNDSVKYLPKMISHGLYFGLIIPTLDLKFCLCFDGVIINSLLLRKNRKPCYKGQQEYHIVVFLKLAFADTV